MMLGFVFDLTLLTLNIIICRGRLAPFDLGSAFLKFDQHNSADTKRDYIDFSSYYCSYEQYYEHFHLSNCFCDC